MAKQALMALIGRAQQVFNELIVGANSQKRIGQLLLDILASVPTEFDNGRGYNTGEWTIWNGRLVQCMLPTTAGQTPELYPAKWIDNVADTLAKLTGNGPNVPVLKSAVIAYVQQEITKNGTGSSGGPLRATEQQMNDLADNSTYVTPYLIKLLLDEIIKRLNQNAETPDLNTVLTAGAEATTTIVLQSAARYRSQAANGDYFEVGIIEVDTSTAWGVWGKVGTAASELMLRVSTDVFSVSRAKSLFSGLVRATKLAFTDNSQVTTAEHILVAVPSGNGFEITRMSLAQLKTQLNGSISCDCDEDAIVERVLAKLNGTPAFKPGQYVVVEPGHCATIDDGTNANKKFPYKLPIKLKAR